MTFDHGALPLRKGGPFHQLYSRGGANLWTALKIIVKHPETLSGAILSTFSVANLLDHASAMSFGQFSTAVLEGYRETFHAPFNLLSKYLAIHVPTELRDVIILWITVSVLYTRAVFTMRRLFEERRKEYSAYTKLDVKAWDIQAQYDQIPERKNYYDVVYQGPLPKLLNWFSDEWRKLTDALLTKFLGGEGGAPKSLVRTITRRIAFVALTMVFFPAVFLSTLVLDDFLVVARSVTKEVNGHIVEMGVHHRAVLSLRAFFVVQAVVVAVNCLLMAQV